MTRRGRPAIAGCSHPEARAAVLRAAKEVGAELVDATTAAVWRPSTEATAGLEMTTDRGVHQLRPRLAGAHQEHNLALAVLAAERLHRLGWAGLDSAEIAAGAARCRWPGRLESVSLPHGPRRRILLDVAHNPDAAALSYREFSMTPYA